MFYPVPGHESVKYIELEHKSLATGWCYGQKWINTCYNRRPIN